MKQFLEQFTGPYEPPILAALLVFAYVGALVSIIAQSTKAIKDPTKTWNFFYMVRDNASRIVLNVILIALSIRFYPELFGKEVNMYGALLMGLGYDKLLEVLRNFNIIDKKSAEVKE